MMKLNVPNHPHSDNGAVMLGFSRHVLIESGDGLASFAALVHPDTDLDDRFKCFDTDNQEWLLVNGWNCIIEDAE